MAGMRNRPHVHAHSVISHPHPVGHVRAFKVPAFGNFVTSHPGITHHHLARLVVNLAVQIGMLVCHPLQNLEAAHWRRILVNARGHGRPADLGLALVNMGLLFIDNDLY